MINVTSPVVGTPCTGLTSPTYTVVSDTPPVANSKQWAVSSLGGTQTGVSVNTVANPFILTFYRPTVINTLKRFDAAGRPIDVPKNVYALVFQKGASPFPGVPPMVAKVEIKITTHAGSETNSAAEIAALLSCSSGVLAQLTPGILATIATGVM